MLCSQIQCIWIWEPRSENQIDSCKNESDSILRCLLRTFRDSTFLLCLQPTTGQASKKSQVVSSWKPAGGLNHWGPTSASELSLWPHPLTKTKSWNQCPFQIFQAVFRAVWEGFPSLPWKPYYVRNKPCHTFLVCVCLVSTVLMSTTNFSWENGVHPFLLETRYLTYWIQLNLKSESESRSVVSDSLRPHGL